MNKYDVEHVVTAHPKMTQEEWEGAYLSAWDIFYTSEHIETILRRAYATGINIRSLMPVLMWFSSAVKIEKLHPLQWGLFRLKYRKDRRPGLPLESPWAFYGSYVADMSRTGFHLARRWLHLKSIVRKIEADPNAKSFMDGALTPVAEEDAEHMDLYTQNDAARVAVERERRVAGHKVNGHVGASHPGNGHDGNGHDAEHHDHHDHDHADEPRPEAAAPPV